MINSIVLNELLTSRLEILLIDKLNPCSWTIKVPDVIHVDVSKFFFFVTTRPSENTTSVEEAIFINLHVMISKEINDYVY